MVCSILAAVRILLCEYKFLSIKAVAERATTIETFSCSNSSLNSNGIRVLSSLDLCTHVDCV